MSSVVFYILQQVGSQQERLRYACKVVETAYKKGHRILIIGNDTNHCIQIDRQLWTFRQGSFVPHDLEGQQTTRAPIRVSSQPDPAFADALLLNLSDAPVAEPQHYERVLEVITKHGDDAAAGRQRYRHYRQLGVQLQHHDITA